MSGRLLGQLPSPAWIRICTRPSGDRSASDVESCDPGASTTSWVLDSCVHIADDLQATDMRVVGRRADGIGGGSRNH